jgi:hypothetical protein
MRPMPNLWILLAIGLAACGSTANSGIGATTEEPDVIAVFTKDVPDTDTTTDTKTDTVTDAKVDTDPIDVSIADGNDSDAATDTPDVTDLDAVVPDGTPSTCGDKWCVTDDGETCETCPEDCGACVIKCGDAKCSAPDEDCTSCPKDCGICPVPCGDGTCKDGENCSTCPDDCGKCPDLCGDKTCKAPEDCKTCPADCGVCPPSCGDSSCKSPEDCKTCPADCGMCPGICNPLTSELCTAAQQCYYTPTMTNPTCSPVGALTKGSACQYLNDCAKGMLCVNSVCAAVCDTSGKTAGLNCALPAKCAELSSGGKPLGYNIGACLGGDTCNVLTSVGCPSGMACSPVVEGKMCVPAGTGTLNVACLNGDSDCTKAYICMEDNGPKCKLRCNTTGALPKCTSPLTCVGIVLGDAQVPAPDNLGVCN